jgi:hypothetical protein
VFDQREDDGTVLLLSANPPAELHDDVRRAAALCPALAITVIESSRLGSRGRGTRHKRLDRGPSGE